MSNYIDRLYRERNSDPVLFETHRQQEWYGKKVTEVVYEYETISKIRRIAYTCFAILVFPVGIALIVHRTFGKILFGGWITRRKVINEMLKTYVDDDSNQITNLVTKRLHLRVDGKIVDAVIFGRLENLQNGKWNLVTPGAWCCMEELMCRWEKDDGCSWNSRNDRRIDGRSFDCIGRQNYLLFNYPGVGGSEGFASRSQVINTHEAMLRFLEDSKDGIGAKEIICWGRSIGGAIQAESLKEHTFQNDITYKIVADRTFSCLSDIAWYTKVLKWVGWKFDCTAASERLEDIGREEIILQTAHDNVPSLFQEKKSLIDKDLHYDPRRPLTADQILDDRQISPHSSLAYALLTRRAHWTHKKFISVGLGLGHYGLPSFESCKEMGLTTLS